MCADLGQVQYVLSDKTGTLTKNQMVVQQFSIGNAVYGEPLQNAPVPQNTTTKSMSAAARKLEREMTERASRISIVDVDLSEETDPMILTHNTLFHPSLDLIQSVTVGSPAQVAAAASAASAAAAAAMMVSPSLSVSSKKSFFNPSSGGPRVTSASTAGPTASIPVDLAANNDIVISEQEQVLMVNFLRVLVYCNTAMIMPDETGRQDVRSLEELQDRLQAESPDEVALILSASEHCKVLLEKRSNREIVSRGLGRYMQGMPGCAGMTADTVERVELLAINEFDSDRKMMSVIVRLPNGKNYLLCKGADSSVLKRCMSASSMSPYLSHCRAHIDYFANTGLRTLALAYREVGAEELTHWMNDYLSACNSLQGRKEALRDVAIRMEKDMTLLGAIGIEDELQDGVPEAIQMMHSAGINVWMITGDKAETAVAIGKKCALIKPGKHIIERVINLADEALRQRILDLHTFVLTRRSETNGTASSHMQSTASTSSAGCKFLKFFECVTLFVSLSNSLFFSLTT
jgi:magnesium-transporting ATPase (P-type)